MTSRDSEPPPPPPGGPSGAVKVALALMALTLLAMMAWLAASLFEDPEVASEPPLPELPEPAAPRVSPMVATSTGYGWTWVNPRPRAMPTWYAVDAAAGGDRVVMVGVGGAAIRYDGGELFSWPTGTDAALRGVAWTGSHEALVAGDGGALVRLRADARVMLDSGVTSTLRDVVALSATEAIVVGDEGTVLRVVGDRVTALDVGADADLTAVHVDGGIVFAVGTDGTVLRLQGTEVTREPVGVTSTLRGIGGCPQGEIYAAGDGGVLLRRRVTGAWSRLPVGDREAFTSVACDHGRVAVTRESGEVRLMSGAESIRMPAGFDRAWHAVSGNREGASWLVGVGGRLATIEADHVRTRTAGPTHPIRALGSMGGALVAVGEWGRILRERERGLERVESPTEAGLAGLLQLGEGRLLAVGDYGAIVDIRHDRTSLLAAPTRASLRGGVAGEGDALLIVGAEGTLVRGTPGDLTASQVPEAGDLWAAAGQPGEAIVVGDDGLVLRVLGHGFTRLACHTQASLRDVVAHRGSHWAVGAEGTIARIDEGGCTVERRGGPDLHAVGIGPAGRVIAGGDGGVVLERGEDGTWTRVGVDVAGTSVRAIWRSRRDVYLAGTSGAIVRHVLVDGT